MYDIQQTLFHLPPLRFHCVGGCWDYDSSSYVPCMQVVVWTSTLWWSWCWCWGTPSLSCATWGSPPSSPSTTTSTSTSWWVGSSSASPGSTPSCTSSTLVRNLCLFQFSDTNKGFTFFFFYYYIIFIGDSEWRVCTHNVLENTLLLAELERRIKLMGTINGTIKEILPDLFEVLRFFYNEIKWRPGNES